MMNTYEYEDLETGHREEFSVTVTEEMLDRFRDITGDMNPFHRDDDFAKKHGFRSHAAFGMLTASFLSTLAGMYLPGEKSISRAMIRELYRPRPIGLFGHNVASGSSS